MIKDHQAEVFERLLVETFAMAELRDVWRARYYPRSKKRMPAERKSINHRFIIGGQKVYLTVGEYDDGTLGEFFIMLEKTGSEERGIYDCFAIACSMGLQHGIPLSEMYQKFSRQSFEPSGVTNQKDIPMAKSIVDMFLSG